METHQQKRRGECLGTGICWREPANNLPEIIVDYCQETSLHGVKYICQPKRHLCERLFWLITLIGGGITAGLLIGNLWEEYLHQPIISFSPFETTIEQIPFPAVTIYHTSRFQKDRVDKAIRRLSRDFKYPPLVNISRSDQYLAGEMVFIHYICTNPSTFGQRAKFLKDQYDYPDFVDAIIKIFKASKLENQTDGIFNRVYHKVKTALPCKDMIKECLFNDIVDCKHNFHEGYTSGQSFCTFNLIPTLTLNHTKEEVLREMKALNETTLENMTDIVKQQLFWSNDLLNRDGLLLSNRLDAANGVVPGNLSEMQNWYTPTRQRLSGKSGGLTILLDPTIDQVTFGLTDSEGFLLQVHPVTSSPNGKNKGIFIKPNTEVSIEVTPTVTLANENLRKIPIEYRNCYFQNEKPLMSSWFYTQDVCIDECITNMTQKNCNCDLTRIFYTGKEYCELENFFCAHRQIQKMSRSEFAATCECLPLCTTVYYTTRVTVSEIDSGYKRGIHWALRIKNKYQLSIVHIYFVEDFVYARERKKLYGWVDLVANAGGVLGLCLGFSALSLLECAYFLTFRLWCRNQRRKTFSEIVTTNMARLLELGRQRQTNELSEARLIQLAMNNLVEEGRHEMSIVELPPEESNI